MAFVVTGRHVGVSAVATPTGTLVTDSVTPTASSLLLVFHGVINDNSATDPSFQSPSGGSLSYAQVCKYGDTINVPQGKTGTGRMAAALYRANVGASPSAHTITVDPYSGATIGMHGAVAIDITGHSSLTQVVQSKIFGINLDPAASGQAASFEMDSPPATGNLVVCGFFLNPGGLPSGVTTPTVGGQTFTASHASGATTTEPRAALFHRVWTGAESNRTITTSNLGTTIGQWIGFAVEVLASTNPLPPGDPGFGHIVLEDGSGNLEMEGTTEDYLLDTWVPTRSGTASLSLDGSGATSASASATASLSLSATGNATIPGLDLLVVHDDVGPSADDTNLINALTTIGHTVTTAIETSALPDVGYDAVILTESGSSSSTAVNSIAACLLPVMMFETSVNTALLATAGLTTSGSGTQYDLQGDPHGLNAGFPDPLTVFSGSKSFYGVAAASLPPGGEALAVGQGGVWVTAWVIDGGAQGAGGSPVPARRAAIGLITTRLSDIVSFTDSRSWFDGIVRWLGEDVGDSASGTASLSLSGSGAAEVAIVGSGQMSISGAGASAAVATATASLSLSGAGVHSSVGSASLSLSGSGTAQATTTGSASLSLSGSGIAQAATTGSASLSLSGSGTAQAATSATASLSLVGSGTAQAATTGMASVSLSGSGSAGYGTSGAASLTMSGSGTAQAASAGSASLSLSGSGTALGATTGSGSLELSATGAALSAVSGTASLSLSASADEYSPVIVVHHDTFDSTGVGSYITGGGTFSYATGDSHSGSASLQIDQNAVGFSLDYNWTGFPIEAGKAHTVSVWLKDVTEVPGFEVEFNALYQDILGSAVDFPGQNNGIYARLDIPDLGSGWSQYTLDLGVAPPLATHVWWALYNDSNAVIGTPVTLRVDDLEVIQLADGVAGSVTGSSSLDLSATGSAAFGNNGLANLSLTGSGAATTSITGSASLELAGTAGPTTPVTGTGSLSLIGTGVQSSVGTGSLSLTGSATASAALTGTGSVSLSGTGVQSSVASGSLSLSGSGSASAVAVASGSLTLSGAAVHSSVASSSLSLNGSGTGRAALVASAALTLSGTGTARAAVTGSASLDLSAEGVYGILGDAFLTLTGSGTARVSATASASLSLSGSGVAGNTEAITGTASLTLSGTGAARASVVSSASLSLSGSADPAARPVGSASLSLQGTGASAASLVGSAAVALSGTSQAGANLSAGSANLQLGASGATRAPVTGTASIDLLSSSIMRAATSGSATVFLSAVGSGEIETVGSGSLDLTGTTIAGGQESAFGVLVLTGSGAALGAGEVEAQALLTLRAFQTPRAVKNATAHLAIPQAAAALMLSQAGAALQVSQAGANLTMTQAGAGLKMPQSETHLTLPQGASSSV